MIVLDTHIWVMSVDGSPQLPARYALYIDEQRAGGLAVSCVSCWEVAKLVELGRLAFTVEVLGWLEQALGYPGMQLVDLTPQIAVESTRLPGTFHRDPSDQIIVATARVLGCPLVTLDHQIRQYAHVQLGP
ncbi:MAG: type II toxin-antitoxin system VapC family toxin [Armatimonadetes bacterium]|nr:type II toxin-antitoxin system VapC family toxin [Armatimonadota bacterium]